MLDNPIVLDRTGAQDGQIVGIDKDGTIIQEHERGEPYNSGEGLFEFGIHNITDSEKDKLLIAMYYHIWPERRQR